MPERLPCDQDTRDRVTGDLGTTFLLEASAGTGKTKVLVDRYVRCVLDPELGSGDVRTVAAITFTEKAAGELRQRVREELERRAQAAAPGSAEAAAVARALDALDDAPISTIHGFAGRLLREFPVEAGVDPAFEQLDGLSGEIQRARLWEEWLGGLATARAGAGGDGDAARAEAGPHARARAWMVRLLQAGVALTGVRELAAGAKGVFGERYDVDPLTGPPDEPDLVSALDELSAPLGRLHEFCAAACLDQTDNGFAASMGLAEACETLLRERPSDVDRVAAALYDLPAKDVASAPGGAQANWDAAHGGKQELQVRYQALVRAVVDLRDAYATFVTGLAVAVADDFSRWAGAAQIGLGRLDFTDLLGRLRDLLRDDVGSRRLLQKRFRYLLVDEFQDTDPLQAEIVLFLCETEAVATGWRDVVLEPGKLFVVGDPKQSIYRFRRADITLYDEVKALVCSQPGGSGAVEAIRQNFRTTPAVAGWVNDVFAAVFDSDAEVGRQPGYERVEAYRPDGDGSRVAVLLGREYGTRGSGEADAARGAEARALADLLVRLHGEEAARWGVRTRASRDDDAETCRAPRWGDIALLFRATTGLETYEQALREAGVPYRVDGGKSYFDRREVADALVCLRAVHDPSDGPALYGALHSSFFGFSDDDLFLYWADGGRFDLFDQGALRQASTRERAATHGAIVAALDTLAALHARQASSEAHELAGELVRLTREAEFLAATGAGAPQAIANLHKLVERARAFTEAGGGGLGAFLDWAAEAGDASGEQESQVDDEGDVVHLLTIHKAKGLEYPIVVLVGGALGGRGGEGGPIVDRARRRLVVRLKAELPGRGAQDLEPRAYTVLKEREVAMAASEMRRLLYVAATRARDQLVVTCFGKLRNKDGKPASVLLGPLADALPAPGAAPPSDERDERGVLVLPRREAPPGFERDEAPDVATLLAARAAWSSARRTLLERATRPARATSPSQLEHLDDDVRRGGAGAPAGRARALAVGSAVHRVMELADFDDEGSLPGLAGAVCAELGWPDLAERAAALAGACWRSAPVRAAARSAETQRELPIGVLVDDIVVSGAVDLLYLDGEEWVIVDYKTDADADEGVLRDRYTPQGAAYALAVEAATGGAVREVVFVAAAADGLAVPVPVDDALRESARAAVRAAADEGRAVRADSLAVVAGSATGTAPAR